MCRYFTCYLVSTPARRQATDPSSVPFIYQTMPSCCRLYTITESDEVKHFEGDTCPRISAIKRLLMWSYSPFFVGIFYTSVLWKLPRITWGADSGRSLNPSTIRRDVSNFWKQEYLKRPLADKVTWFNTSSTYHLQQKPRLRRIKYASVHNLHIMFN